MSPHVRKQTGRVLSRRLVSSVALSVQGHSCFKLVLGLKNFLPLYPETLSCISLMGQPSSCSFFLPLRLEISLPPSGLPFVSWQLLSPSFPPDTLVPFKTRSILSVVDLFPFFEYPEECSHVSYLFASFPPPPMLPTLGCESPTFSYARTPLLSENAFPPDPYRPPFS